MKNKKRFLLNGIFVLFFLISFSAVIFSSDVPLIEVVNSVPVETSLKGTGTGQTAGVWVEMITSARYSLDFAEFYIISEKNEPLEPVISALKRASERGVKIRFLIENNMLNISAPLRKRLETFSGLEIRIFNWKDLTGGIMHTKYFLVDDREAFIGSQNFDWRALKHIHETGLRIRDRNTVDRLKSIFEADWKYSGGDRDAYTFEGPAEVGNENGTIHLTASPPGFNPFGVGSSLDLIRELIGGSKKKITLQLLNYSMEMPESGKDFTELHDALVQAASRGVAIRIAVSDWNLKKPGIDSIKALAAVKGITVRVFTIPEYSGGFIPYARVIHSKVMRVDDLVSWVGTSNWGYGYFYHSRNVEVILRIKEVASLLDALFTELWDSAYGQILDPGKEYTAPRTH